MFTILGKELLYTNVEEDLEQGWFPEERDRRMREAFVTFGSGLNMARAGGGNKCKLSYT